MRLRRDTCRFVIVRSDDIEGNDIVIGDLLNRGLVAKMQLGGSVVRAVTRKACCRTTAWRNRFLLNMVRLHEMDALAQ